MNPKDFAGAQETATLVENAPEVKTEAVVEAKVETPTEVKTEPVVEAKTEAVKVEAPAEVKTETKETPKEEKSFFDKFTKKDEIATETKAEATSTIPAELQAEIDGYKAEIERYKENPLAKLLAGDLDLTNIDLKDFLTKAVGEDFSKLNDDQLIEKSLTSDPHFEKLSPEEQQEELDMAKAKFDSMSRLERLRERESIVSKLNTSNPSELLKSLQEIQANQKNLVDPDKYYEETAQKNFSEKFEATKSEISELAKSLVGQKYGDFEVGGDIPDKIVKAFEEGVLNFSADDALMNAFYKVTYDDAVKSAYERGKAEATKQAANPSQGMTSSTPTFKEGVTGLAGLKAADFRQAR